MNEYEARSVSSRLSGHSKHGTVLCAFPLLSVELVGTDFHYLAVRPMGMMSRKGGVRHYAFESESCCRLHCP
jgi:hypothetical protein